MILPNTPKEEKRRGGLLGFFDRAITPNQRTGMSPLTAAAAGLDALILPEMRMGDAIRQQGAQRAKGMAANRTAETLRAQGREDLAKLLLDGGINAQQAISMMQSDKAADLAFRRQKDLATLKEKGRVVDASVLRQMFPGAKIDDGLYNLKPDGTANKIGGGGVSVQNVIKPGQVDSEDELRKKLMQKRGEGFSKMLDSGSASASSLTDLNILQQLAPLAPSGPLTGRLTEMFPEFNDVASLRQSIVKRVAPTLRVEGSGATSDLEFNAMLNSLGSLRNTPEANQAIIAVMQEKAKYNMDRAAVIRSYETNKINLDQANEQLASLDSQSRIPAQVQLILDQYSAAGQGSSAPSGAREKRWNPSLNNGAGGFE
jgi:hypothetical protein